MPQTVTCVLPHAVAAYLSEAHPTRPPLATLAMAVRWHLNEPTNARASMVAGIIADERGTTKTAKYREALIAYDPAVAELWPAIEHTPARLAGIKRTRVTVEPKPRRSHSVTMAIKSLRWLQKSANRLTTKELQDRIDAIIDLLTED